VTFSLIPHLRRWEMACRRDLISDDRTYFVEFDVTALMAGDYEARSQFLREMFNMGAVSVDEIRQSIGYNKLPNGEGDKRFVQVNMQLLDAFTPESPTGEAQPQASAGSQTPEESPSEEQPAQEEPQPEPAAAGPGAEEGRAAEALWQTTLRRLAATEADGILDRRNKPAKLGCEGSLKRRDRLRVGTQTNSLSIGWIGQENYSSNATGAANPTKR
jgi:hypothetical protein